MKLSVKTISVLLVFGVLFATESPGLVSGQDAVLPKVAKWLRNGPATIIVDDSDPQRENKYAVVVCWGSWLPAARDTLEVLSYLQRRYAGQGLKVIVVSRENERKLEGFLARGGVPDNLAIGLDDNSWTTKKFMEGDHIYPKAFVINSERAIIWDGQVIDLSGVLKKIYNGSFDALKQRKLSALHLQMQAAMRGYKTAQALRLAQSALELEPGDALAIRTTMYIYENSGRVGAALKFIDRRIKKSPEIESLYFVKLNFLARQPDLGVSPCAAGRVMLKRFPGKVLVMVELSQLLMNRFGYSPGALDIAGEALAKADAAAENLKDKRTRAIVYGVEALFYARIGLLDKALDLQKKSAALLGGGDLTGMTVYFENLIKLNERFSRTGSGAGGESGRKK